MKQRGKPVNKQMESLQGMEFAKEFFSILDTDDSGSLDFEEFTTPLIMLGLSTD
jgi:Ca2+-binding EF-hand superfamily protein